MPPRLRQFASWLFGGWHTSSRCVAALALVVLIFCNVPGQLTLAIQYDDGFPHWTTSQFEHGWPFTYVNHTNDLLIFWYVDTPPRPAVPDCFRVWDWRHEFRPWALLANGCVVLLLSLAIGRVFEFWRRRRNRIYQLHLSDFFLAVVLVALLIGWYVRRKEQFAREHAHLVQHVETISLETRDWPGGITWLRALLGDGPFEFLDRPYFVQVRRKEGWAQVAAFTHAREFHAEVQGTTADLAQLTKLPHLEAITLSAPDAPAVAGGERPDAFVAELPPLPQVRALYLSVPVSGCRRIDRLSGLQLLRIERGIVDDRALREIGQLRQLRELTLDTLIESADLSFLSALPQLHILNLFNGKLGEPALQNFGRCQGLEHLDLRSCQVDIRGVSHLWNLSQLQSFNLRYTNVSDSALSDLHRLTRLRELYLDGTNIGDDLRFLADLHDLRVLSLADTKVRGAALTSLIPLRNLEYLDLESAELDEDAWRNLQQMEQLKSLTVPFNNRSARQELEMALPNCQIY